MSSTRSFDAEELIGPLYFTAFLLVATPLLDFGSGILPLNFANVQWRFGVVGLLSGFLMTPVLGVLLAMGVAHYAEHYAVQRVVAVLNLIVAGLFLALLVLFALDIVQLNSVVQPEAAGQFHTAATKAAAKHIAFVALEVWLGVAGWKMSRPSATPVRKRSSPFVANAA